MDDPTVVAEDPEVEIDSPDAGWTSVFGPEGWESADYVDPEDDWDLQGDGSYLSPDGLTRTWLAAGPEPARSTMDARAG